MIDYKAKFCLKGKNAVVTGGAGLIGREVVAALAQSGAHVIIADVDVKRASTFALELAGVYGLNVEFHYFDVTDIKGLKKNITSLASKLRRIDIWVNSAYPRTRDWGAKVEDVTPGSFCKNVEMQMVSYAMTSKYAAEHMKKSGGSIINFGSTYGMVGSDFSIYENTHMTMPFPYAAIKAGVVNLGRYLASYFGSYGVRVNTVCPGGVADGQNPSFIRKYSKKTLLKRMARAEEIAPAVLFLASDASSYVTGAVVMVDGGWTAI